MDLTHDKKLLYVSQPCTSSSSDADVDFSTVVTTVSCTSCAKKALLTIFTATYVRTRAENETNQMKAYSKQQDEIQHSRCSRPYCRVFADVGDPNS